MDLRYFCGIGAELKRQRIDFDYMNQIYLYVLHGTETLNQVTTANFFNDVAVSLQPNDVIFIYSGANSLYTPYKVTKDEDNNVTLSELLNNSLKALIDSIPETIGNLLSDGSIPMDTGYTPTDDQEIATKKYVDDNAGLGNLLSDGTVPMDTGYTPTIDLQIATKKYADDTVSTAIGGLGDLAFLDTVGSAQIDTGAVGTDELNATAISGQTEATIAADDTLLFLDTTDGALKEGLVSDIADVTASVLATKDDAVITADDKITFYDATDSDLPKTDTVQGILDLVPTSSLSIKPVVESMQVINHTAVLYTGVRTVINNSSSLIVLINISANYPIRVWLYTVDIDGVVTKRNEIELAVGTNVLSPHKVVILDDTNILVFFENSTASREYVTLFTVSNNVMTQQNTLVFDTIYHSNQSFRQLSSNTLLYCYNGATNYIHGCVLTVSGNAVSKGTETQITTVATGNTKMSNIIPYIASIDRYLVTGNVSTTNLHGRLISVSGSTITVYESASENIGTIYSADFLCTDNKSYLLANNITGSISYGSFGDYYDVATMTLGGFVAPNESTDAIAKQMRINVDYARINGNYTLFRYQGSAERGVTCLKVASGKVIWSNHLSGMGPFTASAVNVGYEIHPLASNYFMEVYCSNGKTGFRKIKITE